MSDNQTSILSHPIYIIPIPILSLSLVIQGETGCGKSSRIPVMLLRSAPDKGFKETKLFISQPRRIAAKALVERVRAVEPELSDFFALRMGHGIREYETSKTRAWFVTTGYLVRKLIAHPQEFTSVSHLIIDEVHERSIETDVLCMLCRRLLANNDRIRLVLMSATLAAELYKDYFNVPEPPIRVGARRFPVKELYLNDVRQRFTFVPKVKQALDSVAKECERLKCKKPPSATYMQNVLALVPPLAMSLGKPGSSVLIFVPGMGEIVAIIDQIESMFIPGIRFTCLPIHSDIPFEDQLSVFGECAIDEVKIIVATNAAESSVTLPDVDHVICLGLCKTIEYNPQSHRQILTSNWISRASATQRAGRTGRVRPGTVYRLYTQQTFLEYMRAFEVGEILRMPLDSVILDLKVMLPDESVTDVLLECIEPPNIQTIDRSFASLHQKHFLTSPDSEGGITRLGSFVASLGVELSFGSLIGLGIQFGVGAEAIQMAATLSIPKSPWSMASPLIHDSFQFNGRY
jgi:HrpA-like RNA helicase